MDIDVFTLFPAWFDWFRGQRHVANALALGSTLECVDYRAHTPLRAGQVDDTPFGGGAGMVLRVDVVEAALRARYGADPVACARPACHRAHAGGRLLDDALVEELAAEDALTLLCGRYEGFDERILEHFCTDRLSIGRYVLAGGELAAMVGLRRRAAQAARARSGTRTSAHEESFSRRARGRAGVPALHAAGRLARLDGARRPAQRPPRADPGVAAASSRARRAEQAGGASLP